MYRNIAALDRRFVGLIVMFLNLQKKVSNTAYIEQKQSIMDLTKIIYWISTLVMCAIFAFSAGMYFTKYEMVTGFFQSLGYPTYIVYPLAVAKVLGIIAVLSRQSKVLKEWAYAGFFFDAVLATAAHTDAGHGLGLSVVAIIAVVVSRIYDEKMFR